MTNLNFGALKCFSNFKDDNVALKKIKIYLLLPLLKLYIVYEIF